jgi:hypothetical protein
VQNTLQHALTAFDQAVQHSNYNMFNCSELGPLIEAEQHLAVALMALDARNDGDLRKVRGQIRLELTAKLIALSLRMASNAVQSRCFDFVGAGARALVLDDDVADSRDILLCLAVLHDAGSRLKGDMTSVLCEVSKLATTQRGSVIESFLNGPDYMKSLTSMGVDLIGSSHGPGYKVRLF